MSKPSAQKQVAIDKLVRETAGTKNAIVRMVGCRYTTKHTHYQQYLLSDGRTVFVNLSKDPMTAYLSKKPNAKHMAQEKRRGARAERKIAAAKKAKVKS